MDPSRRLEVTRRLVAALVWLALVCGGATLVHFTEVEQRRSLDHLFASRAATSAQFIQSYAADVTSHNVVLANAVLRGRVTATDFSRQMQASGIEAAVVVDSSGRAVAVYPSNPALVGTDVAARYAHLREALTGKPTVSNVVLSAVLHVPVVGFATPFQTPDGQRVFSPAYQVGLTPLQTYLHNEGDETDNEAIYLVDSVGMIVSSGGSAPQSPDLVGVDPELATAAAADGVRTVRVAGVPVQVVTAAVQGTPWRVVVTTPTSTLYASITATDLWVPRLGLVALALALLVVMILLERVTVQRSRIILQQRAVTEAADHARDEAVAATKAKSAFLSTMSHEIRTPMNAVIGMTDLLLGTRLDDQQRDFVQTVHSSGQNLMLIINDILDFSKIEAGQLQLERRPFPLGLTVEDCLDQVAPAAEEKGLRLYYEIDPSCPSTVVGDQTRIRQVLLNLLSNAVKFTATGEVLVSVTGGSLAEGRNRITLSVRDTGIGIPADRVDRLFESFSQVDNSTTREYGGSGLGLAISRSLATAMGGDLTVDSRPGVGSTFRFSVVFTVPDDGADGEAPLPPGLTGRRVVVVDGHATGRRVLVQKLAYAGVAGTPVATGAAARTLLCDDPTYDAVVLDAELPDGHGADLGVELRRVVGREIPLVLLTRLRAQTSGPWLPVTTRLPRPVRRETLAAVLADLLAPQPETERPVAAEAAPARPPTPAARSLRVLLAEDNPVNQRVAQLMLAKLGHVVDTVGNGAQAVAAAHATAYDLVLMDVQMPVLDGLQATRRIRAELPRDAQPQILALTASASVHDQNVCLAAGMDGHLPKPMREAELRRCIEQVAARRLAETGAPSP